jgi:hypothetical protein
MDAKEIAREMIKSGHSKEEILSNLKELGINAPEKFYEDAMLEEGKGVISKELGDKKSDDEEEAEDLFGGENKPLFGDSKQTQQKPTREEKRRADKAVEDIPQLEITNISDEGEKIKDIGEMLGKDDSGEHPMKSMPKTSFADIDELERKLNELISITKAVYEIDRKILEANRDLITKLKSERN